ncbi:MAG: tetratricopeptide repeat protein, partial [Thermoplasmata archaeon]|nr:tetratricopeptide repeat protein [Thermoplasmata archaeon]
LAMLHYIARNTRKNAVLLVGTYRSEEIVARYDGKVHQLVEAMEKMGKEELVERMDLGRLSPEGCHALICGVLGSEIEKEFSEKLYRETEGNTFFVVEILKNLYEERQLDFKNGRWTCNLETLQIPKRIYEVVLRRIQRLVREEREVLDAASVLGEEFTSDLLSKVTELPRIQIAKVLLNIERVHRLITTLKEKYRFEHAKIREVLYAELSDDLKNIYHEMAGKIFEEEYRTGKSEVSGDVVYHYAKAGVKEKVIEYGLPAGKFAKKRFANEEAIRFYRAVIDAMGETEGYGELKLQVLDELAEVLELRGRYDEALETLKIRVANLVTENPVEAGKSYRKRCEIYTRKGDYENALAEAEKAEQILSGVTAGGLELARVWSAKGYVYERKGDYWRAIELQDKARAVFERAGAEQERAGAIHRIGTCYWYLGEYGKSLVLFGDALAIREKLGDLRGLAATYNNIGIVYYNKCEYLKALEFSRKSLELLEKIGDAQGIAASYNNIGIVYRERGDYSKALEFFRKSLELKEKIGDLWGIAASYNNIGVIYLRRGEYEKALEFCSKSLELREKIGAVGEIAVSYTHMGEIYKEKGEYRKALEWYTKSYQTQKEIGDKAGLFQSLLGIAECHVSLGNSGECHNTLEEAESIAREIGEKDTDARWHYVSAKFFAAKGNIDKAEKELEKAVENYESIGKLDKDYYEAIFELGVVRKDRDLLEKALAFSEKIGNEPWAARVRKELEKTRNSP